MSARVPRSRAAAAVETATRRAVMARDAGLRRISAVTRWTAAAVIALSAALALVAAKAFHGHTVSTTAPQSATAQDPASSQQGAAATQLQQPAQVPAPVQQVPVVVSGASRSASPRSTGIVRTHHAALHARTDERGHGAPAAAHRRTRIAPERLIHDRLMSVHGAASHQGAQGAGGRASLENLLKSREQRRLVGFRRDVRRGPETVESRPARSASIASNANV